jgi:hypothetical protein
MVLFKLPKSNQFPFPITTGTKEHSGTCGQPKALVAP